MRHDAADRFEVESAGTKPDRVRPEAIAVMKELGIDISGQKTKSVAQSVKEYFGYVIAICDTAKERSPIFPFTLRLSHWSIVDPDASGALLGRNADVFRRVRDEIKDKVIQFIADTTQIKASEHYLA